MQDIPNIVGAKQFLIHATQQFFPSCFWKEFSYFVFIHLKDMNDFTGILIFL
jgi:hypothetical protein